MIAAPDGPAPAEHERKMYANNLLADMHNMISTESDNHNYLIK